MDSIADIKNLVERRLEEATVLFNAGFYEGAYYLAGYSVELALKVGACKAVDITNFFTRPESKSFRIHDLNTLLVFSGYWTMLQTDFLADTALEQNWRLVCKWSEQVRYKKIGDLSQQNVEELFEAILHPQNGILTWIKKYW